MQENNILALEKAVNDARIELRAELATVFPTGKKVLVFLHANQRTPTPAEVISHLGSDGHVRVRLKNQAALKRIRKTARDVHHSKIIQADA